MSSGKFKQLKLYLQALPPALPLVDAADQNAKINRFLAFSVDEGWINQSPIKSHHAVDPEADPLRWLDDGIPDLSGFEHRYFDLVAQFDISRYIDILADSVSDGTTASNFTQSTQLSGAVKNYGKDKDSEAGDFAPEDDEWGQWS